MFICTDITSSEGLYVPYKGNKQVVMVVYKMSATFVTKQKQLNPITIYSEKRLLKAAVFRLCSEKAHMKEE